MWLSSHCKPRYVGPLTRAVSGEVLTDFRSQVDNLVTLRNVPDSPANVSSIVPKTDSPSVAVASLPNTSHASVSHSPKESTTSLTEKEREANLYPSRIMLTSQ